MLGAYAGASGKFGRRGADVSEGGRKVARWSASYEGHLGRAHMLTHVLPKQRHVLGILEVAQPRQEVVVVDEVLQRFEKKKKKKRVVRRKWKAHVG
jgi:hypothetical protein